MIFRTTKACIIDKRNCSDFFFGASLKLILMLLVFSWSPFKVFAVDKKPIQILILNSWQHEASWFNAFDKGLIQGMQNKELLPFVYHEFVDTGRFTDANQQADLYHFLKTKYRQTNIDFVIADGIAASEFLQSYPDSFNGATRINIQTGLRSDTFIKQTSNDQYEISASPDFDQLTNLVIATTKPETLVVIANENITSGQLHLAQFRLSALKFVSKVNAEYLVNLSADELIQQLKTLPKNSAILYMPFFVNREQNKLSPYQLVQKLAAEANAPIFTHWQPALGSGVLGGYMLSSEHLGKTVAETIVAIENKVELPTDRSRIYQAFFDARQLERWEFGQKKTGNNTQILFQEPNAFRDYRTEFITATLSVATFALLALISFKNSRNSQAELERIESDRDALVMLLDTATRELVETKIKNEQLAQEDELSGLHNRRAFMEQGESVNKRAKRYNQIYCVLTMDIDHFRDLNETHGRTTGNSLIKAVAGAINESIRKVDIAGRIGKEEFAVILPYTSAAQGKRLSERVSEKVTQLNIDSKKRDLHITISVGITENRKDDDSINIVLERAYDALHDAKELGDNQIKVA